MNVSFHKDAWNDYLYWQKTDKKMLRRINELIKAIQRSPFEGIGKPEPLKFGMAGKWSRRINHEHRLVYQVKENTIFILQCRSTIKLISLMRKIYFDLVNESD